MACSSRPRVRHALGRARGISTLEVLVGGTLALVMVSALYSFLHAQERAFAMNGAYTESQAVTRTVIDVLTRELRMATYNPTGGALPPSGPCCPGWSQGIIEARPDLLHFRQDLDGDGAITGPGEDLVYSLTGSEIRRSDGGAPQALVTDVPAGGLVFRYFDGATPPNQLVPAGTPPALTSCQRDCVTKVRIEVHAEVESPNPQRPVPLRSEATSEVAIRNRSLGNF